MKPSNKLDLSVPDKVAFVSDLITYIREKFALKTDAVSHIILSLDGFHLEDKSIVDEVLTQDDIVTVCATVCEPKKIVSELKVPSLQNAVCKNFDSRTFRSSWTLRAHAARKTIPETPKKLSSTACENCRKVFKKEGACFEKHIDRCRK